ncbi:MAG: peptidase M17 [Flavobacteriales bacterium]|nr:peptidase M17 [Flavobacteriales bacterium]
MAITFSILKKGEKYNEAVYFIQKASQIAHFPELNLHKEIILEKIAAEKPDTLVTYNGKKKITVAFYFSKEKEHSYRLESIRAFGNRIGKLLNAQKQKEVALLGLSHAFNRADLFAFLEGLELGSYQFLKYKSKKSELNTLNKITLENGVLSETELKEFVQLMEAVSITKDLVNEPVITLDAVKFSKEMEKLGKANGFSVEVLNKAQIKALNMGGLLGVNMGSDIPPTFNILTYKPRGAANAQPLVLVGKGVVFDTGGYSLKVGGVMQTMKCDMAGAAAVVGAITAIAKNKLPVYVVGLIPATDNRINGSALVVDDVITMHDGTTVEVQNTDAEGRLILADALAYAKKYKPELVIDLATLTGAAAAITGQYGSAVMGNESRYKKELIETGEETYERLAEMPFWREYDDLLKSDIADIRNIGGATGGAITAGKFLARFTDYNWVHIDIAGPAFLKDAKDYHHKGASGVGVRLLYQFAKKMALKKKRK